MDRSHSDGIFQRMRQISMRLFLCVVVLAAILPVVGCTDGGSRAGQEGHASHKNSDNVKVALRPEHDSGAIENQVAYGYSVLASGPGGCSASSLAEKAAAQPLAKGPTGRPSAPEPEGPPRFP